VLLDYKDLNRHETLFESSLSIAWNGKHVHVAPPNSQGLALLVMLGLSEAQPSGPPEDGSDALLDPAAYLVRKHAAFRIRDTYCADRRRVRIPDDLLNLETLMNLELDSPNICTTPSVGDTSTLVVIDSDGNAVSWVQSLFESFGSGVVCPNQGVVLHNRAMLETLDDHPVKGLKAGYRPFHTLCPALVTTSQGVDLAIATPGDHGQPQTLFQVIRRPLSGQ
jgi:gamma-glutamyltranspeptidase